MRLRPTQSPGKILGFCARAGALGIAWITIAGSGVNFLSLTSTLTCAASQSNPPNCQLSKTRLINTSAADVHNFMLYDAEIETHESSDADSDAPDTHGIVLTTSEGQVTFSPFFESGNYFAKERSSAQIQQFLNHPNSRSLKLWSEFIEFFWITGGLFILITVIGSGVVIYQLIWLVGRGQEPAYWSWQKHSERFQELQFSPEAKVYQMPDQKDKNYGDPFEFDSKH